MQLYEGVRLLMVIVFVGFQQSASIVYGYPQ